MKMSRHIFATIISVLFAGTVSAQLRGTVTDADDEPLAGATIVWAGTTAGTASAADGSFEIARQDGNDRLVVRFIGFEPDTVVVPVSQRTIRVRMTPTRMDEVVVLGRQAGIAKNRYDVINSERISSGELLKAACCNLGESFETNPSVDVSYSDAATGARQIRLLGLSGSYVQMLSENIPNFRGVASPYALGYIPGPFMESISVSKGTSSVKNGYEAITGQIDVEYKKPQSADKFSANLFGNSMLRYEANADGTIRIDDRWSTILLGHFEDQIEQHDSDGDGFADQPSVRQVNAMNKWAYDGDRYKMQAGIRFLDELRESGQVDHSHSDFSAMPRYRIDLRTDRVELFTKNAYIFDAEHGSNIALMAAASLHSQRGDYGYRSYDVDQRNLYASLMYETQFSPMHSLSAGLSYNYDSFDQTLQLQRTADAAATDRFDREFTAGGYVQYTFNLNDKLIAMAGLRADYSNLFKWFVTPRLHLKYNVNDILHLRLSGGKGFRTAAVLAENSYWLAGSRRILIDGGDPLSASAFGRDEAWNYGASAALYIPVSGNSLNVNLEFYETDFLSQLIADTDTDSHTVDFVRFEGRSYSRTYQIDASYPILRGLTLTAAYRRTDVRRRYGESMREVPLTGRYKGMISASYLIPPLGKWQIDVTLQLNGGGRMPDPDPAAPLWNVRYPSFQQLNAQITRFFRRGSVYIGGENLTGFKQRNAIISADNPWGSDFDAGMVWGPMHGAVFYIGARFNIARDDE